MSPATRKKDGPTPLRQIKISDELWEAAKAADPEDNASAFIRQAVREKLDRDRPAKKR